MSNHPQAFSEWNILPEDLDCEKNPFLQMSQDQIQKLDAVLSSEQARALLRDSSSDKLFSDSDKLDDVLNHEGPANPLRENKLPAALEETLGVSLRDLEHLVLDPAAATELFPDSSVASMHSDYLSQEMQSRTAFQVVWLDHCYAFHPSPASPEPPPAPIEPAIVAPVMVAPPVILAPVFVEAIPRLDSLLPVAELTKPEEEEVKKEEEEKREDRNEEASKNESPPEATPPEEAESDSESCSVDADQWKSEPRRRSQRQIDKLTREQVDKIRAENAESERQAREQMDTQEDSTEKTDDAVPVTADHLASAEAIKPVDTVKRDADIAEAIEQFDAIKQVDEKFTGLKKGKKRSNRGDSLDVEAKSPNFRNRSVSESSFELGKGQHSPGSVDSKDGSTKRKRKDGVPVSPNKKLDDEGEGNALTGEKSPSPEKERKKKKVKKEKSYEEGPEPALFSFPDKMIKGKNDVSPDTKLLRRDSATDKKSPGEETKIEVPVAPVKPESKPSLKRGVLGDAKESKEVVEKPGKVLKTVEVAPKVEIDLDSIKSDQDKFLLNLNYDTAEDRVKPDSDNKSIKSEESVMKAKPVSKIEDSKNIPSSVKAPQPAAAKQQSPEVSTEKPKGVVLPSAEKPKSMTVPASEKPKVAIPTDKQRVPLPIAKPTVAVPSDKQKILVPADKQKNIVPAAEKPKDLPTESFYKSQIKPNVVSAEKTKTISKPPLTDQGPKITRVFIGKGGQQPSKTDSVTKGVATSRIKQEPNSLTKIDPRTDNKNSRPDNRMAKTKNAVPKSKSSKKSSENSDQHKHRTKRTIKKKVLAPNEVNPDEASDNEVYSDDPNDSDWDSEDDPEKLWCICKQPSNDRFMIQCDPCSNWFHGTCVGITAQQGRQIEKEGIEWHCPQCVKAKSQVHPVVAAEPKAKPVKAEPKVTHTQKLPSSGSSNANLQCIVCKGNTKRDTVYCGEKCIEQHVREVLKLLTNTQTGKEDSNKIEVVNVGTPVKRVVVMERFTGKLFTGPNAPTQDSLLPWLKANPSFEALKPGPSSLGTMSNQKKSKPGEKEEKPPEPIRKNNNSEPVRINVRKTLKDILISRCKDADDIKLPEDSILKLTAKIEDELFRLFKDTNSKYKAKYRSLMFNVKDPRNQGLFRKIVNRKIPPHQLVRMSPEELASKELAKWRERENQHALEMIKKDQLENQQMQGLIIKKTHKGEVEIEGQNLTVMEPRKDECMEGKGEDMSDITAMLADSTSEHRMHLFDLNCQICTGRKSISDLPGDKASPEKRKIKVARTISLEKPLDNSSKENTVVVVPKVVVVAPPPPPPPAPPEPKVDAKSKPTKGPGPKPDPERTKDKNKNKVKPNNKNVSLTEEPADHEPTSTVSFGSPDPNLRAKKADPPKKPSGKPSVWKGFIYMMDVTKFVTSAHKVSGPTSSLAQEIPDTVQVVGRIPPEEVWSYLSKIKQGGMKELIVMRFKPANDEERNPYEAFYHYLNSRKRYGVVRNSSKMIKDFYIIPLGSHSPVPTVLMPFDGPGLDASRPNLLLGVIVRHKHRVKPPAPTVPVVTQPKAVEKYEPTERSYTPPLDAMPCQSTTVDSSNSTTNPRATLQSGPRLPVAGASANPSKNPVPLPVPKPVTIPGILSPSTLIPSSLIASILAPKMNASGNVGLCLGGAVKLPVKRLATADDEPYEPSYTPPLEKTSKQDEGDKPYDPDDLEEMEVNPRANARSILDPAHPGVISNPGLDAQRKLLEELTRQVEEEKEQIEIQKNEVLAKSGPKGLEGRDDMLLPEMLQSILRNIRANSEQQQQETVNIPGLDGQMADLPLPEPAGNPIPVTVRSTSLSSMSAKELVERAQRELADLQKTEAEVKPERVATASKNFVSAQTPIPTISDVSAGYSHNRASKAEPPPPGVDIEELHTDYEPSQSWSNPPPDANLYPALAPPFQRPNYYQHSQPLADPFQAPPPNPAPQWGNPRQDVWPPPPGHPPPPNDPFFQGTQWGGPWNQPPPGWDRRPVWGQHGQDSDARDSDLRIYQSNDSSRQRQRPR